MIEFFGGCASGIMQSLIGHPFDTIKILQQTQSPFHKNVFYYYKGVSYPTTFNIACNGLTFDIHSRFQKLTCNHYIAGGLTGFTMAPFIYYFDVGKIHYQLNPTTPISLSNFKKINGFGTTLVRESIATSIYMGMYFCNREKHGSLISGGMAVLASWSFTYPLDVVKTRQMNNITLTFRDAIERGNLWRGFTACATRAILVNAVGFWAYDKTITYFIDR